MSALENMCTRSLNPLLKMAVTAGVETAVRLHIHRGDDLDARDDKGLTPLMIAAVKGRAGICRLLLAAGANPALADPSGRDALAMAKACNASEVEAIIAAALAASIKDTEVVQVSAPYPVHAPLSDRAATASGCSSDKVASEATAEMLDKERPQPVLKDYKTTQVALSLDSKAMEVNLADEAEFRDTPPEKSSYLQDDEPDVFDLSGWEAEKDGPAPEGDHTLPEAVARAHQVIAAHKPIDTAEDWADFEVLLPDKATPLPRAENEEGKAALHRLFVRAVREGSVPESLVKAFCEAAGGERNEEWEALLGLVLNEIGAETDERMELEENVEDFQENDREEEVISDALSFLDDLALDRCDTMRLYLRDIGRVRLLTAADEAALGRDMEEGTASTLDALASWPEGVARVLAAADRVRAGEADVESVSSGRSTDLTEPAGDAVALADGAEDEDDSAEGAAGLSAAARDFLAQSERV